MEKFMNREQATANLKSIGIEEPTQEQITNYLNQVNGETKREKDRADKYKADAELTAQLQAKIDEINNANLSELEKANLQTETANKKIAELEKDIKIMNLKTSLAENGIVGEDADNIVNGLSAGTLDANALGSLISKKVELAVAEKEKEFLLNTPNPNGGTGNPGEKSDAEKLAEKIGGTIGGDNKVSTDVVSKYL